MSNALSLCLGGSFVCAGVAKILDLVSGIDVYLKRKVTPINPLKDNTCKQICRIFANALNVIGYFAAAAAAFILGTTLFTVGPQLGFIAGFNEALYLAFPAMISSFGSLLVGEVAYTLAR